MLSLSLFSLLIIIIKGLALVAIVYFGNYLYDKFGRRPKN